ncbi:mucin-binding protein [Secundilactobacillus odoratitofui]|uniref:mucin-binding protein n=1 Tax=Secundilactobacillus odoratitofui TaxID=480930 RepID=UPI0006D0DA4F|nr:LPXTG cell wall anchor domain-containing protein [Secundilactobacillus odoratitofui]
MNVDGTTNGNDPIVQTVTYKTTTDSLTGETIYTPQNGYYEVKSPAIKGYKPDQAVIAQQGLAATNVAPTDSEVVVTYNPTYSYGMATSTRTINFVNSDGTASVAPIVQTVTYKTVTNDATGETVYTPTGAYYEVKVPTQANYTPEQATVAQVAVGATTTAPTDTSVTVTYNPTSTYGTVTSTRTINFVNVDGTINPTAPIVQTITYKTVTNAATGETIYTPQGAYYEVKVPTQKGYVADKTVIAQVAVSATNVLPTDTTVTVNYTPTYSYGTATSTRTINFVNADGTTNKTAPVVQTITYKTVTNDATGETVYTPQGAYYEYQVPTLTGYTASQTTVAQATVGATTTAPENTTVTITYTKNATKPDEGGTTKPDDGGTTTPDNGGTTTPDNGGTTTPDNGGTSTGTDGATVTPGWDDPGIVPPEGSFNPDSVDAGATNGGNGEETIHTTSQPTQAVKELDSTESTTEQPAAKQNLAAKRLPQTSETTAQTGSVIGLSLLGLLSVLGLAKKSRRED